MAENAKILVVDDEPSMREFLVILLNKNGFGAHAAASGAEALTLLRQHHFDLIVSDIRMPDLSGLDLLENVKQQDLSIPVVLITAYASPEDAVLAMKNGAYDYITKPFKVDDILSVIKSALGSRQEKPPAKDRDSFAGIIGNSPEMLKIYDLIQRIGPTQANVLIYGESGTGKELVAQAIHQHSNVAANAFVPITCSAIPENLIESELFGHAKGSFTGAIANKTGLFELANNGSAFLDEIGELSPLIQTKLLRVLQEREFKKGDHQGQGADHFRHQQEPGRGGHGRPLPGGSLLPSGRCSHPHAAAARAQGGCAAFGRSFSEEILGPVRQGGAADILLCPEGPDGL